MRVQTDFPPGTLMYARKGSVSPQPGLNCLGARRYFVVRRADNTISWFSYYVNHCAGDFFGLWLRVSKNKGGRPRTGRQRLINIPDPLWDWCKAQGGPRQASEYVRRLIKRDRDERRTPRDTLHDLDPLDAEDRDPKRR